jgi:cytochrome b subunit of formate dehydrogenase
MAEPEYIKRLHPYHRVLHVFMALSFMGLVISGMPLKYSYAVWAAPLIRLFGGYHSAGLFHRTCAAITFGYFGAHILFVAYFIVVKKKFRFDIFGPESMVPRWKDIADIFRSFKWFLGMGPRPSFDRWTYWEKFDYWAVFWGVGVIGATGLLLWFPGFFSRFLPGWIFNVATIIHSDEALLAAGFIFTIHFFNTHLRPEKFPMDTVIFTGRLSMEDMKHDKPLELRRLEDTGGLGARETGPPPKWLLVGGKSLGFVLLTIGFVMLILIIIGQFFS